jgi:uncharacterized protein YbaR (Trm112 family)
MVDHLQTLLPLLRCPLTGARLDWLDPAELARLNGRIAAGEIENRGGRAVVEPVAQGLVNADHSLVCPVRGGIVVMVDEELLPYPDVTD